jgi:23S rRNA (guanine745-N1)-methyltransferase
MTRPYGHDGRVRADIVQHLRCPVCHDPLCALDRSLRCGRGHSFDLARQGYADLTAGRVTHAGDTPDMVAARASLLAAGHFRVLEEALLAALGPAASGPRSTASERSGAAASGLRSGATREDVALSAAERASGITATREDVARMAPGPADGSGLVVEVGAGTGHYLAKLMDARPDDVGLAVDVSKAALRRAGRAHPRIAAVRADAWRRLPVADGAATAVLDVFAPRSGAEFRRILAADGVLIVATPAPEHLAELVTALDLVRVDPDKPERLRATLEPWFHPAGDERHIWRMHLTAEEIRTAVAMGPSARHTDPSQLDTIPMEVTAAVDVTRWRPRP